MSLQSLTPPRDITWKRMAYSRDMIDTNFGALALAPKWRSSLAVYYYVVPEEETADAYPDSRIVYLKLTCSVTGWNPSEELRDAKKIANESGALDDLQKSIWEVITAKGWANVYWPCLGAIAQLAVYPGKSDVDVGPDDYPYVVDFEPKKRELYESVTESSEVLAGSSERVSTTKGSTTTKSAALEAGFAIGPFGSKASGSLSKQTLDNRTTDTGRESRETEGRSTSFSQMYQLFNGYHLATNRALFVIAPRPHIASSGAQTDFNLIDGERKLEGIQEMFVVVHLPRSLKGLCIQASLDTGHTVQVSATQAYAIIKKDNDYPSPGDDAHPPPPPDPPPPQTGQQLVVTRRIVQSCGNFEENSGFTLTGGGREPFFPPVVFEDIIADTVVATRARRSHLSTEVGDLAVKAALANQLNTMQSHVVRSMMSGVSAGSYTPRPFTESNTFLRLSGFSLKGLNVTVEELLRSGHIDETTAKLLYANRLSNLSQLFDYDAVRPDADALKAVRAGLMRRLLVKSR